MYSLFLKRMFGRFIKSPSEFILIIQQEFRLAKKLITCQEITLHHLCEVLAYQELIEKRTGNAQSSKDSSSPSENGLDIDIDHDPLQNVTIIGDPNYQKIHYQGAELIRAIESHRHKVIVKDFIIVSGKDKSETDLTNAIGLDIYDGENSKIIDLEFVNCVFANEFDRSMAYSEDSFTLRFEKFENSTIRFIDCVFWGASTFITQKSGPSDGFSHIPCVEYVNTFSTSIYDEISVNTVIDDRRYQIIGQDLGDGQFMSFFNTTIDNCQFGVVHLSGFNFSFKRKNLIKNLNLTNPSHKYVLEGSTVKVTGPDDPKGRAEYQMYWGPYQTIVPYERDWEGHRTWLLELKAIAEKKEDTSQKDILNREIMKCDRELIRQESWLTSWQDRLTLWFNATFSNYGISWFRPFMLLIFVNFLYSLLAAYFSAKGLFDWDHLHTFLKCFNPLFVPEVKSGGVGEGISALLLGAGILQKFFFAVCVYEIIRAGRRFSKS